MTQQKPHVKFEINQKIKNIINGSVTSFIIIVLLVILGLGSVYTLKENEQAVVTTFGVPKVVTKAGINFKVPFIQKVQKITKEVRGLAIGYIPGTQESIEEESLMITYDFNFINVDFYIEYQVVDAAKAVYASEDPVSILKFLAQSYIRDTVGMYNVDDVITTSKIEIEGKIMDKLLKRMEQEDIGIQVTNVSIQDAEPTSIVLDAFKQVETAKQTKETSINNANKYANEQLPKAEAEADEIIKTAEAEKQSRINEALGQVARFKSMYEEYRKNPTITKNRMLYETLQEVLPSMRIIVDGGDGTQTIIPSNLLNNPQNNIPNTNSEGGN